MMSSQVRALSRRGAAYLPSIHIHHYTAGSISGSHRAPGALTPHRTTAVTYPNIFLASSGFWMQISILCRYLNLNIYLHFTLPWIKSVNRTADRMLDTASPAISHQVSHLQTFVTIDRGEAQFSCILVTHTVTRYAIVSLALQNIFNLCSKYFHAKNIFPEAVVVDVVEAPLTLIINDDTSKYQVYH